VRHGFTLASLCRCGVPSGDFGIGVVTKGSDRPVEESLWAEIEIDETAAIHDSTSTAAADGRFGESGSAKLVFRN